MHRETASLSYPARDAYLTCQQPHCRRRHRGPYSGGRCDLHRILLPRFRSATPGLTSYPPPSTDTHPANGVSSSLVHLPPTSDLDFGPVIKAPSSDGASFFVQNDLGPRRALLAACPPEEHADARRQFASNAWLQFRVRVCANQPNRRYWPHEIAASPPPWPRLHGQPLRRLTRRPRSSPRARPFFLPGGGPAAAWSLDSQGCPGSRRVASDAIGFAQREALSPEMVLRIELAFGLGTETLLRMQTPCKCANVPTT